MRCFSLQRQLCLCGTVLKKLSHKGFSTLPALHNAKYTKSWRHELPYSDKLFHYKLEVPIKGMLHLTTACNTYIKSKYNENEPLKKELEVTIYAKGDQGVKIEDLQRIVDRVHNFRKIVRHKFTGYPPMLRVSSFIMLFYLSFNLYSAVCSDINAYMTYRLTQKCFIKNMVHF